VVIFYLYHQHRIIIIITIIFYLSITTITIIVYVSITIVSSSSRHLSFLDMPASGSTTTSPVIERSFTLSIFSWGLGWRLGFTFDTPVEE